jgi:hypothetical protein
LEADQDPPIQLWGVQTYMKDPLTPKEFFAGRYITFPDGTRLIMHCFFVEVKGQKYYWYAPLPENVEVTDNRG